MFCRLQSLLGRRLRWNRLGHGQDRCTMTYVFATMMMT